MNLKIKAYSNLNAYVILIAWLNGTSILFILFHNKFLLDDNCAQMRAETAVSAHIGFSLVSIYSVHTYCYFNVIMQY